MRIKICRKEAKESGILAEAHRSKQSRFEEGAGEAS
jgi:hypothetical protein